MLFVLLTAILLRWLKIAPPFSWPCPLTGVTGVWYDRIHNSSVALPMLFVLLTAILLGLKLLHLLSVCPLTIVTSAWYNRIHYSRAASPIFC